ncbi:alpha/beta fold hydrolase [Deinococcus irradiatisoli]|uniref:alpha/beta fold hydrolase n=1 Tax=Deinococcus irradiatisoli TaxID=2202254 RepID=UPI0015E83A50|nr:hypothetical protein [Deinococcus irradiatisoli]
MARAIPGARLVILPNVSHFAILQNPSASNRALQQFLGHHHVVVCPGFLLQVEAWP